MDKFHNYGTYSEIAEFKGFKIVSTLEYYACRLIKKEIKNRNVALALSFGKDSMTMLHICHKHDLLKDIKIVMWNNSGIEYPDALKMRDYVKEYYSLENYVETCPDDPYIYFKNKDILSRSVRNDFVFECLETPRWRMMDDHNIDCTLLGLRNEESRGRRINYFMRGDNYYNKREKAHIVLPVAKWKAPDIFTYAAHENIPLHPHYSLCEQAYLDKETSRVNFICDIDGFEFGRMAKLMAVYPGYFAELKKNGFDINQMI